MTMISRATAVGALAGLALGTGVAGAEVSDGVVKIGVLTDMAATYSDLSGRGSVIGAEMAVADFGDMVAGAPIEIISADHQNKADIASAIAREWMDVEKVDVIVGLVTSSVALAVQGLGKEKNVITINSGAASTRLTGSDCARTGFHWAYDTYAMAAGTGRAVVQEGGDTWFFITVDYAFGHSLQGDTAAVVEEEGGTVLGSIMHPFPSSDFSSYLLQAQASGAKIIGLANAGSDTQNAIRQANEFGITMAGQSLAGMLMFITDIHSLGLATAQGLYLTTGFYWDFDDESRAFAARFEALKGAKPTMIQAGVYSSVSHYLKSVAHAGTDDTDAVIDAMYAVPVSDVFARNAKILPNGRMSHDMYLVQVKAPDESEGPWDYFHVRREIPGDDAFLTVEASGCTDLR